MMMTGVRPDRSGVPANAVFDRAGGAVRDLDRPSDLRFPTVIERLNAAGYRTGTVLSKEYLFGIFGTRATYRWEPSPTLPLTNHAPDQLTTDALIAMVERADPDLVFTNLGDIDRVGHSDLTGASTLAAARTAALASTDHQVERFVQHLKETGRWESSVLLVLADHSMDWSVPTRVVSLAPALDADPLLTGRVQVAQNGGADLLYWTGPEGDRAAAVARMREVVGGVAGVLSTHLPPDLRLGPEAGDVVAYCKAGWRFSDPAVWSNPIPGNHGHPATEPIRCALRPPAPSTSHRPSVPCSACPPRAAATTGPAGSEPGHRPVGPDWNTLTSTPKVASAGPASGSSSTTRSRWATSAAAWGRVRRTRRRLSRVSVGERSTSSATAWRRAAVWPSPPRPGARSRRATRVKYCSVPPRT
jgi:hypothetical protein